MPRVHRNGGAVDQQTGPAPPSRHCGIRPTSSPFPLSPSPTKKRQKSNQDVSGAARPYELLALMGPSGAGKSTLLDILAARKTIGRLTGAVAVNGAPRRPSEFVRKISYVPQEDNFMPAMTVAETCALHAALKLSRDTGADQAASRIDEVLCSMGMLHTRDTLVGGVLPGGLMLRGLSGGERRRLSVAVGILASPSIVFLDGASGSAWSR